MDAERHDQVEVARTNPDRLSELWEHALYQRVDVVLQRNTGEDMGEPTQIALDRDDVSIRDGEEVSRLSRSDDEMAPPPTGNNLELLAWGHISLDKLKWGAKGEPNFTLPAFTETKNPPMYATIVRRALAHESLTLI